MTGLMTWDSHWMLDLFRVQTVTATHGSGYQVNPFHNCKLTCTLSHFEVIFLYLAQTKPIYNVFYLFVKLVKLSQKL